MFEQFDVQNAQYPHIRYQEEYLGDQFALPFWLLFSRIMMSPPFNTPHQIVIFTQPNIIIPGHLAKIDI